MQESRPGWMKFGGAVILVLMSIGFAAQTTELVTQLYPKETWIMQATMVFSIDGFCGVWMLAKMFYHFKLTKNNEKVNALWWVTFSASAAASFVQMLLSASSLLSFTVDPHILIIAMLGVLLMFFTNLISLALIIDSEWRLRDASQPVTKASPVSLARVTVSQTAELPQLGAPGRKSTDLEHAKKVARYEEEGICPWKNERQWKATIAKNYPDEETMAAARKELGYDQ